jgi:DNA-binding GntR family transcriptional regulator
VSEDVYRSIKRDIITLRHRPGDALTEEALARRYGVSRVPVREAVHRLSQEGLVRAVPYRGYTVSQVSLREIADAFELRLLLEARAAELAAHRASDGDLARLAELASAEYVAHDRETYEEFLARNLEFHTALAEVTGNRRLARTLADLVESMQRYFFLGLEYGDFATEMREEHQELTRCLMGRDAEGAVACTRRQIEQSRTRILRALVGEHADLPLE